MRRQFNSHFVHSAFCAVGSDCEILITMRGEKSLSESSLFAHIFITQLTVSHRLPIDNQQRTRNAIDINKQS